MKKHIPALSDEDIAFLTQMESEHFEIGENESIEDAIKRFQSSKPPKMTGISQTSEPEPPALNWEINIKSNYFLTPKNPCVEFVTGYRLYTMQQY